MTTSPGNLALAVVALALASPASAVHLDPNGRGQALIYPYYTVNKGQQTLFTLTNTTAVAQVAKVRVNEGYNSRAVLDFNVWLNPYDSWSATLFALRDAGLDRDGGAIMTSDTSCTSPRFSEGDGVINGVPYLALRNFFYTLSPYDGGPNSSDRTHEGWIEVIAMADVAEPLSGYFAHGDGGSAPGGCTQLRNLTGTEAALQGRPSGGLIGSASIIDVARGTYLATRAEGLAGFTGRALFSAPQDILPNLASVNDGVGSLANRATAHVFDGNGNPQTLTFPGPDTRSRRVDAVSAVLMADQIYNEIQSSAELAAGTDWLVTMPTKGYYTDKLFIGASLPAIPPFEQVYDGSEGYSELRVGLTSFNREAVSTAVTGFPTPRPTTPPSLFRTVNTLTSVNTATIAESAVLGSRLIAEYPGVVGPVRFAYAAGWARLGLYDFATAPHRLLASQEGKVLRGLPVLGFWASNIVNNNVSNGVLANYATAVRHTTSVTCVNVSGGLACE